jgi:hypothetical protein
VTDDTARRPRWRPFVLLAVLLALVTLFVPVLPRPPSPGVRAGFDLIEDGMTEEQVEELLGGPRGVHDRARRSPVTSAVGSGSGSSHRSWWYFPDCVIEVSFDEDARVNGKRIEALPPQSLFEKAVRWYEQTFSSPGP